MDFVAIILFLVFYYLRPQEWFKLFAQVRFVQLVIILSFISLFLRERSVKLSDFLKTPHDWMVLFFFTWLILTSPTPFETFKAVSPLAVFYIVIVQTLTTIPRITKYLGWWTFLIVAIAALAIASEHGFDPRHGYDITHGRMKGRLILNLSIFNNPNTLGHAIVPSIPMIYYFCFWKRPFFLKEIGIAVIGLPLWCVWLTVSKGSFLAGLVTTLATLTFGRPKTVQIIIITAAVLGGSTLLYAMPRMQELNKSKTDEAIMGRVAASKYGLDVLHRSTTGLGYGNWLKGFFDAHNYNKAAHSSYVQLGAELGWPGFFLFFGILYCNLRTLVSARTENPEEERIRRILFVLVTSYMISSWMVDLGYRPTFFMFTAAIAAFHRHMMKLNLVEEPVAPREGVQAPAWRARLLPQPELETALAKAGMPAAVLTLDPLSTQQPQATVATARRVSEPVAALSPGDASELRIFRNWNSIGIVDLILIWAFTALAVKFWGYILKQM